MKSLLLSLLICSVLGGGCVSCQPIIPENEPLITGLEGRVLRGPMCPGPQSVEGCPDQPFSAWFDIFDDDGESHVMRFQTDEEGLFEVSLQPGDYHIVPDASAPILRPHVQRQKVTVPPDQVTSITLTFDTGIR